MNNKIQLSENRMLQLLDCEILKSQEQRFLDMVKGMTDSERLAYRELLLQKVNDLKQKYLKDIV